MKITKKQAKAFFTYAVERETIRVTRAAGMEPPWTDDPILGAYRFCNIFREDDVVTTWIRENIRDPLTNDSRVVMAMVAARFFNRVSTLKIIKETLLKDPGYSKYYLKVLEDVHPVVTGAYMIKTPRGLNKLEGVCWIIEQADKLMPEVIEQIQIERAGAPGVRLEIAHRILKEIPYMGRFNSFEVITDLRHTKFFGEPLDVMTWAQAGPGAARGLSRVIYERIGEFNYASEDDQKLLNVGMQQLLALSMNDKLWPEQWPPWEMRDVEHTLCEFDKYERARTGAGRPKQRYTPPGL